MGELARIISDEDKEVGITLPGERDLALFYYESTTISTQLLEGKFPDFGAIIPKSYSTAVTIYTTDLLRACKRAEIFARDSNYSAPHLRQAGEITGRPGRGHGDRQERRARRQRGHDRRLGRGRVAGSRLQHPLPDRRAQRACRTSAIVLESNGSAHAGVIRPENRNDYVYVVMPMSINR